MGWKLNDRVNHKLHKVYLSLGSNIDPEANIPRALELLAQSVLVQSVSNAWETPPVGGEGPNFLNAAASIYTDLDETELRDEVLRQVEAELGRERGKDPNAPRTIDLDILIYDSVVVEDQIWRQAHLAVPLAEILPDYAQPDTGETLYQIACRLKSDKEILPRPAVLESIRPDGYS